MPAPKLERERKGERERGERERGGKQERGREGRERKKGRETKREHSSMIISSIFSVVDDLMMLILGLASVENYLVSCGRI